MKPFDNLKLLWQDKVAGTGISLCLILVIFSFSFFIFSAFGGNFSRLPPEVPLFYSRPWGWEQLALSWQLGVLPFLALIFFIFDLLIATKLYFQYPLLSQILVWSSAIFTLLTTITLLKIILLIT